MVRDCFARAIRTSRLLGVWIVGPAKKEGWHACWQNHRSEHLRDQIHGSFNFLASWTHLRTFSHETQPWLALNQARLGRHMASRKSQLVQTVRANESTWSIYGLYGWWWRRRWWSSCSWRCWSCGRLRRGLASSREDSFWYWVVSVWSRV